MKTKYTLTTLFLALFLLLGAAAGFAHCDTMDSPVIQDAKLALEKSDITPALKWIKKDFEAEAKQAFDNAVAMRSKGEEEKAKSENSFFETLVRLRLQGEGESFTGIKPAGTDLGPAVAGADKSLENGSADSLVQLLTEEVNKEVRERFNNAFEKKKRAEESVDAGRAYVEAYTDFMHYVEGLYLYIKGKAKLQAESEGEHKQ